MHAGTMPHTCTLLAGKSCVQCLCTILLCCVQVTAYHSTHISPSYCTPKVLKQQCIISPSCIAHIANLRSGRSEQGRRHRSLIDVIQDLEQENAAEVASSGVSPASDRPVPLDLSGASQDPLPAAEEQQHQQRQQQQQQQSPGLVSHRLQHSEDGSESLSCPPGATLTVVIVIAECSKSLLCLPCATWSVVMVTANCSVRVTG